MKKFLRCLLVFTLILTLFPSKKVFASTTELLIDEELEIAIISGDGTTENPYVIDYDKAPVFEEYLNEINEKVMSSLNGKTNQDNMALLGLYDGILCGKSHTGIDKGAKWIRDKNDIGPNVSVNGNIWMKKVLYIGIDTTAYLAANMWERNVLSILELNYEDILGKAWDEGKNYLEKKGVESALAGCFAKLMGCGSTLFTALEIAEFIDDMFVQAMYSDAKKNKDGLIVACYQTSYQGKWYMHSGKSIWENAPTAYEPGSFYGTGSFEKLNF